MRRQNQESPTRGGVIINMSSVNGMTAIPNIAGYNASKGGVTNLTRCACVSFACADACSAMSQYPMRQHQSPQS